MSESWASLGIIPLPLLAPSFRVFGDNPPRVWALGYALGASRVNQLDDRWVVDTTEVPKQEGIHPGDAIAWIGDYEGGPGLYLWPPSRVLSAEQVGAGKKSRIRSLRDSWLEPLRVEEFPDKYEETNWEKVWQGKGVIPVSRVALQWWGLDVWCPTCGDLGNPTSFGLQTPPPLRAPSYIQEWNEFHSIDAGCDGMRDDSMRCPRCGSEWGTRTINDGDNFWPEDASASQALTPAYSRTDLMRLFGVTSFDLLIESLDGYTEPDTYISETPHGLDILVGTGGVYLDYPMSVSLIYEYIDELETEYYAETADVPEDYLDRPVILLGWNRDNSRIYPSDLYENDQLIMTQGKTRKGSWSVGRSINIKVGSLCFLFVQGQKNPRGIVAIGEVTSEPWEGEHLDDSKAITNYVDILWTGMLPLDDLISVSELNWAAPDGPWVTGFRVSGTSLAVEPAKQLLKFWFERDPSDGRPKPRPRSARKNR